MLKWNASSVLSPQESRNTEFPSCENSSNAGQTRPCFPALIPCPNMKQQDSGAPPSISSPLCADIDGQQEAPVQGGQRHSPQSLGPSSSGCVCAEAACPGGWRWGAVAFSAISSLSWPGLLGTSELSCASARAQFSTPREAPPVTWGLGASRGQYPAWRRVGLSKKQCCTPCLKSIYSFMCICACMHACACACVRA